MLKQGFTQTRQDKTNVMSFPIGWDLTQPQIENGPKFSIFRLHICPLMPLVFTQTTNNWWASLVGICLRCVIHSLWIIKPPLTNPGPCLTTATWYCHKNFSQWECSFHWKLHCHWLEFLLQHQASDHCSKTGPSMPSVVSVIKPRHTSYFLIPTKCNEASLLNSHRSMDQIDGLVQE